MEALAPGWPEHSSSCPGEYDQSRTSDEDDWARIEALRRKVMEAIKWIPNGQRGLRRKEKRTMEKQQKSEANKDGHRNELWAYRHSLQRKNLCTACLDGPRSFGFACAKLVAALIVAATSEFRNAGPDRNSHTNRPPHLYPGLDHTPWCQRDADYLRFSVHQDPYRHCCGALNTTRRLPFHLFTQQHRPWGRVREGQGGVRRDSREERGPAESRWGPYATQNN